MSNPKDRDLPRAGPSRKTGFKPKIDNLHTTRDAAIDEAILNGGIRQNSQQGITEYQATIYAVVNDDAEFDHNSHAEMTDALTGNPPIRYKVMVHDESSAFMQEPDSYNSPESKIMMETMGDFIYKGSDIPTVNKGDTVSVTYANTISKNGGMVVGKLSKFSDGAATLKEDKRKIDKPSTNFEDKRPQENFKKKSPATNQSRRPERDKNIGPMSKIDHNRLRGYLVPIFLFGTTNGMFDAMLKALRYNKYDTVGSVVAAVTAIEVATKGMTVLEESKFGLAILSDDVKYKGRGLMWPVFKNQAYYNRFSSYLLQPKIAEYPGLVSTNPDFAAASAIYILNNYGVKEFGETWNLEAIVNKLKFLSNTNFIDRAYQINQLVKGAAK